MNKIDLFISRKSVDAPYSQKLYEYLTEQGLRVFESDNTLKELGNADYIKAIDEALANATHMIVVGSSAENIKSSWVEAEWLFFLNRKRSGKTSGNLLTVATDTLKLEDIPPSLANYEVIPYNEKNFPIIYNYVRQENSPSKIAPKNPFPAKKQNKWLWTIVGALLLGIISFAIYFSNQPFDSTIVLASSKTDSINTAYPPFIGGDLSIFINGKEEKKQVLANGQVIFQQLPASIKGVKVAVKLQSNYWKTKVDSLILERDLNVAIIPDGTLGWIRGSVKEKNTSKPIPDAIVKIIDTNIELKTDQFGAFDTSLPFKFQKDSYRLEIYKSGFQTGISDYLPASNAIVVTMER
jgi:hypothetical protein